MSTKQQRGPVEDYYPHYVNEDEVEFDYAYYECRCGWQGDPAGHPASTEHQHEMHSRWSQSPDCGLGKHVIVFEDGSVAEI